MKIPLIAQYHPAAALHQPRLWAVMLDDWQNLPEKVPSDFLVSGQKNLNLSGMSLASMDTETDRMGGLGQWSVAYRDGEGQLTVVPFFGKQPIAYGDCPIVYHNAKYDLRELVANKMPVPKNYHDSMVMAYCLLPSTKVLTRELTWKALGRIKVGDELVAIDEKPPKAQTKLGRRLMKPTKVVALGKRVAPCLKIGLSNGKEVVCTFEHRWLVKSLSGGNRGRWYRADHLVIGAEMMASIDTWEVLATNDSGWLAGILDGEGSVTKFDLQIAQKKGLVLDKAELLLSKMGFRYTQYEKHHKNCDVLHIWGLNDVLTLLGSVRPIRLLSKETWIGRTPSRQTMSHVAIVSIEEAGSQEVISIETEAGTFNAEGFWTHNCLGLGRQAPKDDSKKKSGSDMVGGLGLKYLARRHLGMTMKTWQEVKDQPELVPEYNANDAVATYLLAEKWLPVLPKHYFDIDMPLLPVLMEMEDRGIQIDPKFLETYAKELDNRLARFDLPLNPHATQEIQSYVYGTLGIEPWKFTESGAPSVEAEVLEQIHDPVVEQILAYKELYKDKGTYVENYVKMRDVNDRVHPEFKQTSTSTGRLSCARPNLQNVDKEGEMRRLFVAPLGKKLVRMDYDQLEWRVLAAITQDPILLKALQSGKKIHQVTAEQMGIKYDDAKTGNYAIMYGAQAWTLAQQLHCSINQAREFMALYFTKFPGVKKYQEQMKEVALNEKKVTNWFGRTRRIDAMYVDQWRVKEEGIKEAINTPIQGAGGEICKIAMIALYKVSAPLVLQIHDELLFEVPEEQAVEYAHWLKEYVPTIVEIGGVKFLVQCGIGSNWKESGEERNGI